MMCGMSLLNLIAAVDHSPAIVREVMESVLADPAYEDGVREVVLSDGLVAMIRPYLQKILDFIGRILGGLAQLRIDQPVLFWLIMAALLAVLALIFWHITRSLSLLVRGGSLRSAERPEDTVRVQRFKELWSEAHRQAEAGEYTEAIRHLLLALLARAHDSRVLLAKGWTNQEIVVHLSRQGAFRRHSSSETGVQSPLSAFVGTFDRIWYGRERAGEAEFTRCKELMSLCVERLQKEGEGE